MTYAEAIQFLYSLRWFGAKFGLENTRKLATLAGNPQEKLRFIHVAGTNGKGSTCAMLDGIYRAAGLRVGLYTSPHLVSFRERIQTNRVLISEDDVVRLVSELRGTGVAPVSVQKGIHHVEQDFGDRHDTCPTFFEFVTVMALKFFAEQRCDLVIWETGLGGRLDATNIVTPLASVITNVHFDHQKWLGDTLAEIASEKAGIIKPGVPVITSADEPEALRVIRRVADENHSPLHHLNTAHLSAQNYQSINAALAQKTAEMLRPKIPVTDKQIQSGISQLDWPGRFQLVTRNNGKKLLLDGAHNVAGALALRAALKTSFAGQELSLVLGVLADKDWNELCDILAPLAEKIFIVPVASERSAESSVLAEACRRANPAALVRECGTLSEAANCIEHDGFTVVTGSLYLVGEAMEFFGLSPAMTASERGLNEWGGAPQAPVCGAR